MATYRPNFDGAFHVDEAREHVKVGFDVARH
jgi:hypothetical protein